MDDNIPHVVGFCCQNAVIDDPTLKAAERLDYEPEVRVVFVPCSSKVETLSIIKAFEAGAEGVFVFGCDGTHCRMTDGNKRAQRTVNYAKSLLSQAGMDEARLDMFTVESGEWKNFREAAAYMSERVASFADSPLK